MILKEINFCFIFGQINKSLDLQGSARSIDEVSTKLSTENLDDL
ncbi:hypothetical protein BLL52_1789 [Rhodoferax antarcticus ANT.BR]|uniref:Uncharacterized protein n=1 Tax=Rhodoferax antarcticus ANT.BR TaxID=1111071 RepID=A0A1Q8YG72_9BURK|nr:hypothetical protein BLL52_1789 [Rhodoferax antarcticus ANT.BR]